MWVKVMISDVRVLPRVESAKAVSVVWENSFISQSEADLR